MAMGWEDAIMAVGAGLAGAAGKGREFGESAAVFRQREFQKDHEAFVVKQKREIEKAEAPKHQAAAEWTAAKEALEGAEEDAANMPSLQQAFKEAQAKVGKVQIQVLSAKQSIYNIGLGSANPITAEAQKAPAQANMAQLEQISDFYQKQSENQLERSRQAEQKRQFDVEQGGKAADRVFVDIPNVETQRMQVEGQIERWQALSQKEKFGAGLENIKAIRVLSKDGVTDAVLRKKGLLGEGDTSAEVMDKYIHMRGDRREALGKRKSMLRELQKKITDTEAAGGQATEEELELRKRLMRDVHQKSQLDIQEMNLELELSQNEEDTNVAQRAAQKMRKLFQDVDTARRGIMFAPTAFLMQLGKEPPSEATAVERIQEAAGDQF